MKLTKADFDNAVKQPYDGKKCLVAQLMIREGRTICHNFQAYFYSRDHKLQEQRLCFDIHFHNPGDENKPELQQLRDSLED